MSRGSFSDGHGNSLVALYDGTQSRLTLKLKAEPKPRMIGTIRDKIYYKIVTPNQVFHKFNAFGFCNDVIVYLSPEGMIVYYKSERYYISRERFDNVKQYLHFKRNGFELQCFVPIKFFKRNR